MSYGVIGTNPFGDLDKSVEKLLADFLKANYDQSITNIPVNSIKWEQYGISQGDYAIYLQSAGDFDISSEVSNSFFETDHFTELHVFARSLHDDYERSALKQLFLIEKWLIKTLRQNRTGLADKGIAAMYYRDTRHLPVENDTEDIRRIVVTIHTKILTINNDNFLV
jgi:hypothetical protein